jgi:hypothetical protein
MGRKINIDVGSWKTGYADGQHGLPPQCAVGLDQVWYLSGFCQWRAWRREWCIKNPPPLLSLERRA